jgi:hypothetical protein
LADVGVRLGFLRRSWLDLWSLLVNFREMDQVVKEWRGFECEVGG